MVAPVAAPVSLVSAVDAWLTPRLRTFHCDEEVPRTPAPMVKASVDAPDTVAFRSMLIKVADETPAKVPMKRAKNSARRRRIEGATRSCLPNGTLVPEVRVGRKGTEKGLAS